MIRKRIFDENFSFWKNHGKCKKTKRHQTCNNRKKETIWCQNQIIMAQSFSQKTCWQ